MANLSPLNAKKRRLPHMFQSKKVGLLAKIILLILLAYMIFTLVSVRQKIADANAAVETLTQQVSDQTQTSPGKNWVWWHPMTVCSILPIKGPALYLLIA